MRIARRECLSSQKRLLRGGGEPPGAERREEADSRERKVTIKRTAVPKNPQRQIRKNVNFYVS